MRVAVLALFGASACFFPDVSGIGSGDATAENAGDAPADVTVDAVSDAPGDASSPCSDPTVLAGDNSTNGRIADSVPLPYINAYWISPAMSGRVACAWLYVDGAPGTSAILFGVYSNAVNKPSALLAHATISNPVIGWNSAPLDTPINVTANMAIWFGWMTSNGTFDIAVEHSGCTGLGLRSAKLVDSSMLPAPFPTPTIDDTWCAPTAYLGR